jgi:hypothetical protein
MAPGGGDSLLTVKTREPPERNELGLNAPDSS